MSMKKNEIGNSCLPGGKTHFCPQRLKSKPLTIATKLSIPGFMAYRTIFLPLFPSKYF